MKYVVNYRNEEIEFDIVRKKVKNVNLTIRPDLSVLVSANNEVPEEFIKDFVLKNGDAILSSLARFKAALPYTDHELDYESGESIKYLGKQHRLKVIENTEESVKYLRGTIQIHVKDKQNKTRKKNMLEKWLRNRAKIVFAEVFESVYPKVRHYDIEQPKIEIRQMKARWGSCLIDKKTIVLNYDLIKAPKYCIEYVIIHELVHLLHRNHDVRFYKMLTILMPDWHERKKILDEDVIRDL